MIERLSNLQKIAEILVSKFGGSVNAWVIEASIFNGPFAVYRDFIPSVNRWGEPKSYSPAGFPASTSTISLLSNCLKEAKKVISTKEKEPSTTSVSSSSSYQPKTYILGFSKGGTVLNQLVAELSISEVKSNSKEQHRSRESSEDDFQIIPHSKESLINSITEIHYVDVGLNSAGAYITDHNVIERISKRLMQGAPGIFCPSWNTEAMKKRKISVKPVVKKNQGNVDHVTGDKIPKSFVFSRGKLPGPLKQLHMDLKKLMLPYTALNLREKKRNNLRDFLNVSGPIGVTHFLILSKTETASYLRVARTPQGPTLTFKIHKYSTAQDVLQSQLRPRCPQDLFKNRPLIVLSGFGSGEQHLKLTTIMFQNIFPAIDINTVKLASCQRVVLLKYNKDTKLINFRHYSIRLQPVGVSRRIRKFVQNHQAPDLRSLQDVSDFVTKAGYGSESEADDEAATVTLASDLGRVNRASTKSAVKLRKLDPE
ncbi:hypothetical protein GH714_039228 [Hevea brasiliensis]|uniref:Brix domain-containing protein n=1 Tax=Hevea brasiliensis TaxID=3981 RepID=A0A6A6MQD6_HEVBR|nr:hypothetical protein GH714_039228 [Hevea brasiliensis]